MKHFFKKGQSLTGLATVIILLVIAGIVVLFGMDVMSDVGKDIACVNDGVLNESNNLCLNSTGGTAGTGLSYGGNATLSSQEGLGNITTKFPLLGTIIIVAVILAALGAFLAFRVG